MKVSVIIPVYNIAQYLPSCLDSILAQTFTDFELLLINDGSTDATADICNRYSRIDSRIKVYHKPNGGVSSARNFGIEVADGEWIAFIDGDDYIVPDYLESLVGASTDLDIGMVCCNLQFINPDGSINDYPFLEKLTCSSGDIRKGFFNDERIKTQFYGPVNKIIRRAVIADLRFRKLALGEDLLFIFELLGRMKDIVIIPLIGYQYIKRPGSATTSSFSIKKLDYVDAAHLIIDLASDYSDTLTVKAKIWTLRHSIVTIRQIYKARMESRCKAFVTKEKLFIKANKPLVRKLDFKRKLDYLILRYMPKLYRIL